MINQVVTIGYLKEFVNGKLTVTTSQIDSYCPTYGELTGGGLVANYKSATNPKDTTNGIRINGCSVDTGSYSSKQLVVRPDLELLYMVLDNVTIAADTTSVDACFDGSINVCATGHFHLETKTIDGTTSGGALTDKTIQATWGGNADSSGPSNCTTISFNENMIGGNDAITTNPSNQPARSESTIAKYTYSGNNLTSNNSTTISSSTVTITQGENVLQSWYYNTTLDRNLTISVSCPPSVGEYGGSATAEGSITYEYCEERKDQCGHIVGRKWTSKTVTLNPQTVTFAEQDCEEPARSQTVSFSYSLPNGLSVSDSCTIWQDASTESCYPGENCSDAGCSGRIHWLCTEKKIYENVDGSYEIRGLDENGHLSCDGGTASVRIASSNDREYWTRSAYCSIETLPTVFGNSTSQDNVGLVFSHTGTTGRLNYTNSSLVDTYTYAAKYSAYTRNHITLHNNNESKETYCTTSNKLETIPGTSIKYEANSVRDYYQYPKTYYSRSSYVNAGGDGDDWDAAMDAYYDTIYCASGHYQCSATGEEVSGPNSTCESTDESGNTISGTVSWVCDSYDYNDNYDPRETGMTLWHIDYNVITGTAPADVDMDYVGGACCVRNISSDYDYFWSARTSSSSIIKTFDYPQNTGIEPKSGSVTFTFDNTSPKPGTPDSVTVNYTVASCTIDTDKYTMGAVSGPTSAVECDAIPGNGVTISVAGKKSIIKVSVADPSISGETDIQDVTLVKDTDYTLTYTPTGINDGTEDRTITVTITGIGNYSGQSASFSYSQKADAEKCFSGTSCDPSTTITYSAYSISYNGGAVACDKTATPTVTATKITTIRDAFCRTSSTTQANVSITDFTVSYNPSGNNNGTSNRTVTGTVTHDGASRGTFTYTQNSGATCYASTDVTGSTTEYEMSVTCGNIGNCDTTASPTVSSRSRTGVTHTTGATVWDDWGNWATLASSNYSLSYSPTLAANDTASAKTYTVTATGLGVYDGLTASTTFTQAAGPCGGDIEPTCNVPMGSFAGDYDFRIDFSENVASEVTVSVTEKDANCNVATSFTVTVSEGSKTGMGYNVLKNNHNIAIASYFEITNVSPSEDATYIYWGGDCEYDDSGNCTPSTGCSSSNTWTSLTISSEYTFEECDTLPTYTVIANGTYKDTDCVTSSTSTTLSSSDYTATYSISGKNETDENRTCLVIVYGKGVYDGLSTSLNLIQNAGPCEDGGGGTLVENCGVVTVNGRDWDIELPHAATSDVTFTFYATNGYSTDKEKYPDWNQDISVSEGETTGSARSDTDQHAVDATHIGTSPTGDTTYTYCISEVKVESQDPEDPIYTGSSTQYEIQVLDTTISACDTSASVTVQGRSRTVSGYSDGSTSASTWGSWSDLTEDTHYTITIPTIEENETTSAKTYTATATGKTGTVYAGKTDSGTITQSEGPCHPIDTGCTCSVTSISVSPTSHTFTNCSDYSFSVTIVDNGCTSGCTGGFKVYNSSGTEVANGTSSFTLPNATETYTVKANDDTNKTATVSTTICTGSTSTTWNSISSNASTIDKCATSPSITVTANGTHTNGNCCTSTTSNTLSVSEYSIKYRKSASGAYNLTSITENTGSTSVTWYYEVTANATYGSKTTTGSFIQSEGPCKPPLTCNPLSLSYVDSSRTMTATFDEMVATDVTINFKLNLDNSNSVSDSITISEGNNSNSKTLSTSQSITSTAGTSIEITSVSPTEDSEYEYNCDTGYTITPSDPAPSYEFEVSTSSILIDDWVASQGYFVYVKSRKNGSRLSVSNSSSDFITVSATTNDDSSYDYKYLLIVTANNGTSYRDGSITFTQSETNDTKSISVKQIFNPYVDVTFNPNWTDGNITVASDFKACYKEYGETVCYGAGNGSDDGNWTLTWSHTPTYSGNAGTYNVLIYYWDYATVCGQTITVSACYKGGTHGERCGNDSGTGPTYTPVTPQPSEPSIVTKDGYLQIYNPLSYTVEVYVQHYVNGVASGGIISRTVAARSYENLNWPATGTPPHSAVITSWDEA